MSNISQKYQDSVAISSFDVTEETVIKCNIQPDLHLWPDDVATVNNHLYFTCDMKATVTICTTKEAAMSVTVAYAPPGATTANPGCMKQTQLVYDGTKEMSFDLPRPDELIHRPGHQAGVFIMTVSKPAATEKMTIHVRLSMMNVVGRVPFPGAHSVTPTMKLDLALQNS